MAALDMQSLKQYVTGGSRSVPAGTVLLDVTHNLLQRRFVEIPFSLTAPISSIKAEIYSMTGSVESHMRLLLNGSIEMREEDNKLLGEYGAKTGDYLHVIDEDPFSSARGGALDDVSQVKKFELSEAEYDRRENTYRAYKKRMLAENPNWKSKFQLDAEARREQERAAKRAAGLLTDEPWESPGSIRGRIQVGQRCLCQPGDRRGTVRYVGVVPEIPNYDVIGQPKDDEAQAEGEGEGEDNAASASAPAASAASAAAAAAPPPVDPNDAPAPIRGECLWIGVQFDEPQGKHDGMVRGKRYFQTPPKCAAFLKPSAVKTGDYPEEDPFASSDEEEEEEQKKDETPAATPANKDVYEEL